MTRHPSLTRLRQANPFPRPATAGAHDLFAQITALPADLRLRPRATRNRRRVLVLALALAVMALLVSTAFAISNWLLGDAVRPPVTKAEYRAAQHELTLPPGYSWPTLHVTPNSMTGQGAAAGRWPRPSRPTRRCRSGDSRRVADAREPDPSCATASRRRGRNGLT